MARQTLNVVVPIIRSRKGRLEAGVAVSFDSPEQAKRRAEKSAETSEGAIAFSRSGDPDFGEFDDPVVLGIYGSVPQAILDRIVPMPF